VTMAFRTVKTAIETLLNANVGAPARFRVFGYQAQQRGASDFLGNDRAVRVYYNKGNFPKSAASVEGPFDHQLTFTLELITVAQAEADLTALNDPNSTDGDRAAALLASKPAAQAADESMDEFMEIIFQILMDARNQDLGLPKYSIDARWIMSMDKDPAIPTGKYVVLTGAIEVTCAAEEIVTGEQPVTPADPSILIDMESIDGDTNQKTVIEQEL